LSGRARRARRPPPPPLIVGSPQNDGMMRRQMLGRCVGKEFVKTNYAAGSKQLTRATATSGSGANVLIISLDKPARAAMRVLKPPIASWIERLRLRGVYETNELTKNNAKPHCPLCSGAKTCFVNHHRYDGQNHSAPRSSAVIYGLARPYRCLQLHGGRATSGQKNWPAKKPYLTGEAALSSLAARSGPRSASTSCASLRNEKASTQYGLGPRAVTCAALELP
jgi:hypothetical protein